MPDRSVGDLVEIEDAIKRIQTYIQGMDRAAFLADPKTCDAVALQLLVIGEAARSLPAAVRNQEPEIPWVDIVSVRNRVAHGYRSIDHTIVWEIVDQHLALLATAVRRILAADGE